MNFIQFNCFRKFDYLMYVNLKTQITIYYIPIIENESIMYQPGIRKTYTHVTLALISNVHRF